MIYKAACENLDRTEFTGFLEDVFFTANDDRIIQQDLRPYKIL